MSILKTIIKIAAPVQQIEEHKRYLFIGPHPDDIEIGAGATAAKLAAQGKNVCFLICTDGRYGTANQDIKPEELINIRRQEAIASAAFLGVADVRFLPLCDGGLYELDELRKGIYETIGTFKPDFIFAPDCNVTSECHVDHLNVGRISKECAYFAPYENITAAYGAGTSDVKAIGLYFTAKPNRFVKVKGLLEKQLGSIFECHLSQFPENCDDRKSIGLYLKLKYAINIRHEGFRVLGRTQMHCLPEAGD